VANGTNKGSRKAAEILNELKLAAYEYGHAETAIAMGGGSAEVDKLSKAQERLRLAAIAYYGKENAGRAVRF
jgi:hypothetical protein